MRSWSWCFAFCLACSSVAPTEQKGSPPKPTTPTSSSVTIPLENGDLSQWREGLPVGWEATTGAGAVGVPSLIEPLGAGGLALSGDATTTQWQLISQSFPVKPSAWYRLQFEASVSQLQPGPFVNHWVGLAFFNPQRIAIEIASLEEGDEPTQTLYVRAPEGASSAQVQIFLSQPGRLEVQRIALAELGPAESFEILVGDMARKYSFFAVRQIDWQALSGQYKVEAESAPDPQAFAAVLVKMLAALQDLHIFVSGPDHKPLYTVTEHPDANMDVAATKALLLQPQTLGESARKSALRANLAGDLGYFALFSMQEAPLFPELVAAFQTLLVAPGIVVDLRFNSGGAEVLGQSMVGLLTDQRRVYGKVAYRSGLSFDRFGPPIDKVIEPAGSGYPGKVAVLIGPVCVSSCEGLVMMLKALPTAKLFGQATRGASGNPQPVLLPNGVSVTYPRWKAMLPDGSPLETKGIAPDVLVSHVAGQDPTLDAAMQWLQQ